MDYEQFRLAVSELGLELNDNQIEQFRVYAALLKEWNEKINLTAITEENEVISKHFLDSLLPVKAFDFSNKSIVDIGSGAGFPGLVLAIAYPTSKITLVDATAKKFIFLKEVVEKLGLENVSFHNGRVEDMKGRESFDVSTSRGFSGLSIYLEVASSLVKVGGNVVALKGSKGEEELAASKTAMKLLNLSYPSIQRTELPGGDSRINFFFKKNERTPKRYPRPWAEIVKKPL